MRRKLKFISIFLLVVVIVGSLIAAKYILPYAIIQPPRLSENIKPSDLDLKSSDINILVEDSINLNGYWIKNDSVAPKSIVLLIHGIGGCKEHFLNLSKELTKIGVESILMDSRAHGQSGGTYCTYGFKEKKDISHLLNYIKTKNDSVPIGIWGNSMGGAIAIQALEYDKRISFGIVESTFTSLSQIVYDYQKSYTYGIGLKPLCNIALNEAGEIAGFDPDSVSPISSAKHIEQPVLMAHGDMDKNIKFEYGKALFDNLRSTDKEFISVKNGGHFDLAKTGGVDYTNSIKRFILEHSN